MNKTMISIIGMFLLFGMVSAQAQTASERPSLITVNSSGKVKAKPDICVTVLEVRSSAPLAADALQQNEKRVSEVTAKLKEMGIGESDIHWAGNQFAPSGGGRMYMAGGQRPTGFEVYNVLEVRIKNPDVTNYDKFSSRVASILDELGKMGAGMLSPDLSRFSLGGSSAVVFALENA
ncbi:MAG TPA: SIMPL domain-containing protein, partial [Acidobacteriota bacterium]|nr:SIMPL domain-containing protein [Acidobacteriota bacterium]